MNRPERLNALSADMLVALSETWTAFRHSTELEVAILTGTGRGFCAGEDMKETLTTGKPGGVRPKLADPFRDGTLEKPVIAMIRGICFGGGCSVAVMCDLRLCSDDSRFCIPAARLSVAYPVDRGVERLVHVVGAANATEILVTARVYNAEEAYHMGLVNRVIPKAELESYTREYALKIADNAPLSVSAHKFFVREVGKAATLRDMEKVREWTTRCFNSDDYKEGVAAFMGKRRPKFQGK